MGFELPGPGYVRRLLLKEQVPHSVVEQVVNDILEELRRCLNDTFFRWITGTKFVWSKSEWSLESQTGTRVITSGVIDRVVFDGKDYWIVDYKTHLPRTGEPETDFIERMKEKFRPQLLEYRRLLASVIGIDKDRIHIGIYLTHVSTWVEF